MMIIRIPNICEKLPTGAVAFEYVVVELPDDVMFVVDVVVLPATTETET